jgi:ATP-dependent phosphofructokinase / diphosphate-dependent phosphofructokinase
MAKKRIGILTGGGDVPGLNAIIKTVTYRGSEDDIEESSVSAVVGRP